MKRKTRISLLIFFLLGACGPGLTATAWKSPDFSLQNPQIYAVLPFGKTELVSYLGAAETVTDALETAFLKTGSRLVERNRLGSVLDELGFSMTGLTEEQGLQIGKLLNADVIIMGTVTNYDKGGSFDTTTVVFSVKAIHVQTGAILWKGTASQDRGTKDPGLITPLLAERMIEELMKQP